jgi:hypothetical protein
MGTECRYTVTVVLYRPVQGRSKACAHLYQHSVDVIELSNTDSSSLTDIGVIITQCTAQWLTQVLCDLFISCTSTGIVTKAQLQQ